MPINNAPSILPINEEPLDWGTVPSGWHPAVKRLYKALVKSPFAPYYSQMDVEMMRLLAAHHSQELFSDKPNANLIKTLFDKWGSFGGSIRDRASINLVVQQAEIESEFATYQSILFEAETDPAIEETLND
jgi:hypothetical protein